MPAASTLTEEEEKARPSKHPPLFNNSSVTWASEQDLPIPSPIFCGEAEEAPFNTPDCTQRPGMPKEPPPFPAKVLQTSTPNLKPMPPPQEANFRALRLFLCGTITWSATITACLGSFFPLYMKEEYDTSTTMVGLIFSVTSIVQFLTCPFVAHLSHRISRLGTLRLGLVILIAGGLVFGCTRHVAGFLVGRVLQGMGNGVLEVSGLSLLMRYSPDIRRDIGLLEGSSSLGFLLGPLLGGIIFKVWGFRILFLALTAPFLLFLLPLLVAPKYVLPVHEHRTGQEQLDSSYETVEQEEEEEDSNDEPDFPPPLLCAASFIAGAPENKADADAYFKRLYSALFSRPALPMYICIVLLVSGAMGFFDTALAEHLVVSLGISSFEAGLLFTVQVVVYIIFSFVAAELAFRVGKWNSIICGTLLWSLAMLTIGPMPPFDPKISSRGLALGMIGGSLAVLGMCETFIFLPFVPLFHARFHTTLGWSAVETEDVVASVWTTVWAGGQTLGPLIGGLMMDTLPKTKELACIEGSSEVRTTDAFLCESAFSWSAALWGGLGFLLAAFLMISLARTTVPKVMGSLRSLRAGDRSVVTSKGGEPGPSRAAFPFAFPGAAPSPVSPPTIIAVSASFFPSRHLPEPSPSSLPSEASPRTLPAQLSTATSMATGASRDRPLTSPNIDLYSNMPRSERQALRQKTRSVHASIIPRRLVLSSGLRRSSSGVKNLGVVMPLGDAPTTS